MDYMYVISLKEIFLGFPSICTFNQKCSLGSTRNLMWVTYILHSTHAYYEVQIMQNVLLKCCSSISQNMLVSSGLLSEIKNTEIDLLEDSWNGFAILGHLGSQSCKEIFAG